jgi:hypothetical protein
MMRSRCSFMNVSGMPMIPPPPSRARASNSLSMWVALPQGAETTVMPRQVATVGAFYLGNSSGNFAIFRATRPAPHFY